MYSPLSENITMIVNRRAKRMDIVKAHFGLFALRIAIIKRGNERRANF
jgi:hypothetical protein